MANVICMTHSDLVVAGSVPEWARTRGHMHALHQLHQGDDLPEEITDVDLLCVMGGAMGVYEAPTIPWLARELAWLRDLVDRPADERPALVGICLGAQLLAAALGSKVRLHTQSEIGYWPLVVNESHHEAAWLTRLMSPGFAPFLWHQDTFDIPAGTLHVAATEGCANQAFTTPDGSIVGLQFHPEFTELEIGNLVNTSSSLASDSPYVQDPETFRGKNDAQIAMKQMLWSMLDQIVLRTSASHSAHDTLCQ